MKKFLSLLLVFVLTLGVVYSGNVWIMEDDIVPFEITWRASKDVDFDDEGWVGFDIIYPLDYLENLDNFDGAGSFEVGNDKGKEDKKVKASFLHLVIVGYLNEAEEFIPYSEEPMPMYKVEFNVKFYWGDGWEPFHSALSTFILDTVEESPTFGEYIPFEYEHGYDDALLLLDDGMTPNGFGSLMKLLEEL